MFIYNLKKITIDILIGELGIGVLEWVNYDLVNEIYQILITSKIIIFKIEKR